MLNSLIAFLSQLIFVLLRLVMQPKTVAEDPVNFFYGPSYDISSWDVHERYLWISELVLFCIIVIRFVATYQEERCAERVVRYFSFRAYYRSIYCKLFLECIKYHVMLWAGLLVGCMLGKQFGWNVSTDYQTLSLAVGTFFLSNTFFAGLAAYVISHRRQMRLSLLIYPCIPLVSAYVCSEKNRSFSKFWPGNWGIARRSQLLDTTGFPLLSCLAVELILIGIIACFYITSVPRER